MKQYKTVVKGVCSNSVAFSLNEEGRVFDVSFEDGCEGNLKAVGKLVEGRPASEVVALLSGNTCGRKSTSCADQFASALAEAAGIEKP